MAEGQVRERFELSRAFPHQSVAKDAALCPLPEGEGLLINLREVVGFNELL